MIITIFHYDNNDNNNNNNDMVDQTRPKINLFV